MRLREWYKGFLSIINDSGRSFSERLFVFLTVVSVLAGFIALIGDIIVGESILEIIVLTMTITLVPMITFFFLKKRKITTAIKVIVTGMIFFVLPSLFFYGGGVEGGGVLWIVFIFLYAGLVLSGKHRNMVLIYLIISTLACYIIEYFYPNVVNQHDRFIFYVDSFISLMLVSLVCFFMILFENHLFKEENERAQKEAKRAEELNQSLNRFFLSMSHEIRTPVNSILGLNELILREENLSDQIAKEAEGIRGAGKMLLSLINDIIDFSKMESGRMDIVPVDYKVGDLVTEIVNMVWLQAREKNLSFDVSIDPEVPKALYGDEVRIKQIIINLLNNSVKYTSEGSVGLHIECGSVEENATLLRISVTDTGIGIKKDTIPHFFDAFKNETEATNGYIAGTGLGLSIVKQLVELMGGTITVSSVYGEGSSFNVIIKQTVSDPEPIGELSINKYGEVKKYRYRSKFTAPNARILIVDDNEMNLEIEKMLLLSTMMQIDTADSGKKALEAVSHVHYDAIFMDHLMPEMDGIQCLNEIRNQVGGLNQTTPVIVLTANGESSYKDLYIKSGFDGYLVKPVSGEVLEDVLMNQIISEKIILRDSNKRFDAAISAQGEYNKKMPVLITTSSMCDLPEIVLSDPRLPVLPFVIKTDEGSFKDGYQIGADELVRYIKNGKMVYSSPPEVSEYTAFFLENIKLAHHIIYISLSTSLSKDYERACEASKAFDNVTVINSECVSSATGILVVMGCKLAQRGMGADDIIAELQSVKKKLKCSFVVDNTEFMLRSGRISPMINRLSQSFSLRPSIEFKDDMYKYGGFFIGNRQNVFRRYIKKTLSFKEAPDLDVLFITYVDIDEETLLWIKKEVCKITYFENIIFQQASAAISSNCGPGSFGLLYYTKSDKLYNVSSILPVGYDDDNFEKVNDSFEEDYDNVTALPTEAYNADSDSLYEENKWYENLEGIDGSMALKNNCSEDSLNTVLKIFYDSIDEKAEEIEKYLNSKDFENYTIKVHALKSSLSLIGAVELSETARKLESAGKARDTGFILDNSRGFLDKFRHFKEILSGLYGNSKEDKDNKEALKPVADKKLIENVYDAIRTGAENMDCEAIDEALFILNDYIIPEEERDRIDNIKHLSSKYDYEGISLFLDKV